MYNIPVISMEWNKQISITYTLIYLCKKEKERKKDKRSQHRQIFQGKAFSLQNWHHLRVYSVIYYTLKWTSINKNKGHCPLTALCNIQYPLGDFFIPTFYLIVIIIIIKIEDRWTCENPPKQQVNLFILLCSLENLKPNIKEIRHKNIYIRVRN